VILFTAIGPSLPLVGLSYLIASVAACSFAFLLSRRLCPYLNISPKFFEKSRFKELGGMSLWLLITILGVLLRSQVALIIINMLFGEISGTEYSLALMWFTLLMGISGLITNCFTPMIYSYRGKEDKEGLVKFTSLAIKTITLLMALPIGLVCIFAPQLLTLWVGEQYAHLAPLVWILVIPVLFLIQSACCAPINAAYKRVRGPALIHVIAGPCNIVLALLIPFIFNNGMYGVGISVGIITFIVAGLYSPMYNAYVVGMPLTTFMKPAIPGYAAFCLVGVIGIIISNLIPFTNIASIVLYLIIAGCVISGVYLLVIGKFGFKKEERRIIRTVLPVNIAKHIPHWLF
jgi:membrane protein EpsK